MTKKEARILFMDLMYGELDAKQAKELELFIDKHSDLKQEFEELTETSSLLSHLPVQSPEEQLVIMAPKLDSKTSSKGWWMRFTEALIPQSSFAKSGFIIGSFVFLFIVIGSLSKMNISTSSNGLNITFGEQPAPQVGYSAAQVEMIINQVQKENAQLVNEIVLAAQAHQEAQFEQTFASFANYLNEQRSTDLQLINFGLTSLEETTYDRFRQTDQVLGEIIQTVSTN